MDNPILVSTPPHIKTSRTTKHIMLDVIIALIPCAVMGIVYFGLNAFITEITAVLAAVISDFAYCFIARGGFKKKCAGAADVCLDWCRTFDYTSIVTGLILALILPSTAKWYQTALGAVFAIIIVKMLFGGTGKNIVNPAATGRVFMFISFASIMTVEACRIGGVLDSTTVFTGASYLSGTLLGDGTYEVSLLDLFLGTGLAGCIGETCKAAILVGYIYLAVRKVIKWWQPLLFIATVYVFSLFFYGFDAMVSLDLIMSGGLMFGAVFMATDYTTSPKGFWGQIIYYVFLGILVVVLRYATGLEVVSFVILLGNIVTPLIDRYVRRRPFGYRKAKKVKEAKS